MKMVIELSTGTKLKGDFTHYGHKHPDDPENHPERDGWHYYKDNKKVRRGKKSTIHHLRKEHMIRVTER